MALTQIQNPITHSWVKLIPPVEIADDADLDKMLSKFTRFCEVAWEKFGRCDDPHIIRNLRDWEEPPRKR